MALTSVSTQLTEKIESVLADNDDHDGRKNDDVDLDDDVDLKHYFWVGQYVRTAVISTESGGAHLGSKLKKRIDLSLEPKLSNPGLTSSSLAVGCTVQAAISSIEDHGLIMDLGIEDNHVRGFMPTQELPLAMDISGIRTGAVMLCTIIDPGSNGRIVKLSAREDNIGSTHKPYVLNTAPSIQALLPGTVVEILLSDMSDLGLVGKVMGMFDVTADVVHAGATSDRRLLHQTLKVGAKILGRILCTFPMSNTRRLGFSRLGHVLALRSAEMPTNVDTPAALLSSIIQNAKVVRVEVGLGIYMDLGAGMANGFSHVSRIADAKLESLSELSGKYKIGSEHTVRVLDYNSVDNLFLVSLQDSVIKQPFLRIEDVQVGAVVKGKIEKILIGENGINGLIVAISEGIAGFVPVIHLSDTALRHPEKKFREGMSVSARVLSTDLVKRRVRLTLKKTLVKSDRGMWKDYADITLGEASHGTLVRVDTHGAIVQFYGSVKGFLPVSEMSEAYVKDATQHFQEGQVVAVNAIKIDADKAKLTLSCRDPANSNPSFDPALHSIEPGTLVTGTVFEKSQDDLLLRLEMGDIIGRLGLDQAADGSIRKRQAALSKIRVGQTLQNLLVLDVQAKRRLVQLCNRDTLVAAARDGTLLKTAEDLKEGITVTGFVSNISKDGIFVSFVAGLTGLVARRDISADAQDLADFGFTRLQPVTAKVSSVAYNGPTPRFWLTMHSGNAAPAAAERPNVMPAGSLLLVDPVDGLMKKIEDLSVGRVTKARVVSVKDTQINVELAKDVQGRIDMSEVFDKWDDIKDRKRPLRNYAAKHVIPVRILGAHDARNHKFLPISHRSGKVPVLELSAKPDCLMKPSWEVLTLEEVKVGTSWLAFVNNIVEDCLWVNISPNIRGRVRAIDASDDISLVADLAENFPVGSALRVQVVRVDLEKNRLDLSAKSGGFASQLAIKDISKGMILPGRVTRSSERQILVQLSDNVVGAVNLIDIADNYSKADPSKYQKNDIIRVCVIEVDAPNKKVLLSTRPSKVLSSSLPVEDPEIDSVDKVEVNDIYRGFIANVADNGIFVTLGHHVTALVRISNLSDSYLKEWKDHFERDQLVKGKLISVDKETGHVQMSLKESSVSPNYVAPTSFTDFRVGQVVAGKVAKVEQFGVFIVVDNSENVRGLCHRSEIAEHRIEDASTLYNEGDAVKAKILKTEPEKRRINFGLKASYFAVAKDEEKGGHVDNSAEEDGGTLLELASDDGPEHLPSGALPEEDVLSLDMGDDVLPEPDEESISNAARRVAGRDSVASLIRQDDATGLSVGGFEWILPPNGTTEEDERKLDIDDDDEGLKKAKKRKRAKILVDETGQLDALGPQSGDDYERILLGQPDASVLWVQYMAFHLELGEADRARQIAERALKTIGLGQDAEKMNVWVALLNLENTYGDDDSLEAVFKRACESNDPKEVHSRLASIYVQSGKLEKAGELFQTMLKKFAQDIRVWINYATFLFDTSDGVEKGRQLLPKALQTLPQFTHVEITSKFAQLEFHSPAGMPERGRTIFEGLLDSFPKRMDLWNVLLDLEMRTGDKERARQLFERVFQSKIKNKQARFFFKKWLAFEEVQGDERSAEKVKSRATEFVNRAAAKDA